MKFSLTSSNGERKFRVKQKVYEDVFYTEQHHYGFLWLRVEIPAFCYFTLAAAISAIDKYVAEGDACQGVSTKYHYQA